MHQAPGRLWAAGKPVCISAVHVPSRAVAKDEHFMHAVKLIGGPGLDGPCGGEEVRQESLTDESVNGWTGDCLCWGIKNVSM